MRIVTAILMLGALLSGGAALAFLLIPSDPEKVLLRSRAAAQSGSWPYTAEARAEANQARDERYLAAAQASLLGLLFAGLALRGAPILGRPPFQEPGHPIDVHELADRLQKRKDRSPLLSSRAALARAFRCQSARNILRGKIEAIFGTSHAIDSFD